MDRILHYTLTLVRDLVETHPFWRGERSREQVVADIEQILADLQTTNEDTKKSDTPNPSALSVVK